MIISYKAIILYSLPYMVLSQGHCPPTILARGIVTGAHFDPLQVDEVNQLLFCGVHTVNGCDDPILT